MSAPMVDLREVEALALRNLVDGADIADLRAAFDDARRAARSPEDAERINEMLVDAITLHDARTVSMRREAQLAALCDTAVDLAELRELDEVLRALCQRVRSLLGTDAAYITLVDAAGGDTFIRMTDGIVSEGFRTMRMPLGIGLGGIVAQSGTSATTEDYSVDARFVHTDSIDRLVAAEGLRGIAASPLRRGQDVLGVVLTGSRYPRRFAPSELALLESLATLAAIAIENARLFLETRRTCEELSRANEAVRAHTAWLERSAEHHDRLTRLTLEGAGVEDLATAIADVLGGTVVWQPAGDGRPGPEVEDESTHTAAVPVTVGDENLGTLRLTRAAPITPNALHFLERGSLVVARVVLNERARAEVEQRLAGEVVEELCLGGPTSLEPATRRAAQLGVDLGHDFVVVVASPPPSAVRWSRLRAARAAADQGGLVGGVDGLIVGMVPGDRARAIADEWRRRLTSSGGDAPTIGAAGPARGAAAIRAAYREAVNTHRLLLALDRAGAAATADDVGALGLLLSRSRPGELRVFVADRLRTLDDNEARDGGKLIETLEAFLERNGHLADSARSLHVHVNTLYRRLERIDELLGPEWRAADRRLDLHLAIRLRRLMDRLDVVGG